MEQELAAGVFEVPDVGGAFALLRDTGAAPDTAGAQFVDRLKDEVRDRLPADHVLQYGRASLDGVAANVLARFVGMIDGALEAEAGRSAIVLGSDPHHRMAEAAFAVGASGEGVVGREALLADTAAFLDGPGGALAVVGASGTGKSTLLAEAASRALAEPGSAARGGRRWTMSGSSRDR